MFSFVWKKYKKALTPNTTYIVLLVDSKKNEIVNFARTAPNGLFPTRNGYRIVAYAPESDELQNPGEFLKRGNGWHQHQSHHT